MARSSVPCPQHDVFVPDDEELSHAEEAAKNWLTYQDTLTTDLLRELEMARDVAMRALDRVRRLEDMVARVRGAAAPSMRGLDDADEEINLATATIAEAIWFAVAAQNNGATAAEIQAWAKTRGKVIGTKVLHTYVHRMLGDGRLRAEGIKGSRKYFIGRPLDHRFAMPAAQLIPRQVAG